MDKKKNIREPVQKRGKEKKNRILMTAKRLFIEKNYFEISTNEIAEQADLSIGTLYSYFSSKQDILTGLLENYNNSFLPIFEKLNSQESFLEFKNNTKNWIKSLVDQLIDTEDLEFHSQVEMLSLAIPEVKTFSKKHNEKIKDLTYECFLYYAEESKIHEIKILSIVIFDYISALVDELLYNDHSDKEKELIKKYGIESIYTIIKTELK